MYCTAVLQEARDALAKTFPFDTGSIADLMHRLDAALLTLREQQPVGEVREVTDPTETFGEDGAELRYAHMFVHLPVGTPLYASAPAEAKDAERLIEHREHIAFAEGQMQAITDYAVWDSGEQYVGVMRRPLHEVLAPLHVEVDKHSKAIAASGAGK